MDKYHKIIYKTGSFSGGININLNLITCEDEIFTPLILQINVLHWYHAYLFHTGRDRTEVVIYQYLY